MKNLNNNIYKIAALICFPSLILSVFSGFVENSLLVFCSWLIGIFLVFFFKKLINSKFNYENIDNFIYLTVIFSFLSYLFLFVSKTSPFFKVFSDIFNILNDLMQMKMAQILIKDKVGYKEFFPQFSNSLFLASLFSVAILFSGEIFFYFQNKGFFNALLFIIVPIFSLGLILANVYNTYYSFRIFTKAYKDE